MSIAAMRMLEGGQRLVVRRKRYALHERYILGVCFEPTASYHEPPVPSCSTARTPYACASSSTRRRDCRKRRRRSSGARGLATIERSPARPDGRAAAYEGREGEAEDPQADAGAGHGTRARRRAEAHG